MDTLRLFTCIDRHRIVQGTMTIVMAFAVSACQPSVQSPVDPPADLPGTQADNASILILNPDGSINESGSPPPQSLTVGTPPIPADEPVETVASDGTVTIVLGNRFERPLTAQLGCDEQLILTHQTAHDDEPSPIDCSVADTTRK